MSTLVTRLVRQVVSHFRFAVRDVFKSGVLASALIPDRIRPYLLRPLGVDAIGSSIAPRVFIGSGPFSMGRGSRINYEAFIDPSAGIELGERVRVAPRVTFITQTHQVGPTEALRTRRGPETTVLEPIVVGDNVWIGTGATLLPGVHVGNGTVIAAGAVVVEDCKPNCLYGGVPARLIKELPV